MTTHLAARRSRPFHADLARSLRARRLLSSKGQGLREASCLASPATRRGRHSTSRLQLSRQPPALPPLAALARWEQHTTPRPGQMHVSRKGWLVIGGLRWPPAHVARPGHGQQPSSLSFIAPAVRAPSARHAPSVKGPRSCGSIERAGASAGSANVCANSVRLRRSIAVDRVALVAIASSLLRACSERPRTKPPYTRRTSHRARLTDTDEEVIAAVNRSVRLHGMVGAGRVGREQPVTCGRRTPKADWLGSADVTSLGPPLDP